MMTPAEVSDEKQKMKEFKTKMVLAILIAFACYVAFRNLIP